MSPRVDLSLLQGRAKHISRLKVGLFAFATLFALSVILWPRLKVWIKPELALFEKETARPVNTATKPDFNGVDSHNQPYKIVADFGQQLSQKSFNLTNPS